MKEGYRLFIVFHLNRNCAAIHPHLHLEKLRVELLSFRQRSLKALVSLIESPLIECNTALCS